MSFAGRLSSDSSKRRLTGHAAAVEAMRASSRLIVHSQPKDALDLSRQIGDRLRPTSLSVR